MHRKSTRLRRNQKGKHVSSATIPFTEEMRPFKTRSQAPRFSKDIITEEAIGDGNCAFNAFSLGLFTPELIAQLEQSLSNSENPNVIFKEFIQAVSSTLHIANDWDTVKAALLSLRDNRDEDLQTMLAPILRNLSVFLAKKDASHLIRTEEPLKSAFRDYVDRALHIGNRGGVDDDVFNQHDFIGLQFKTLLNNELNTAIGKSHFNLNRYIALKSALYLEEEEEIELTQLEDAFSKLVEDVQNKHLMTWWKSRGYGEFLDAMMDKYPRANKWAGDLELYLLARYFRINLDVVKQDIRHHIYLNHGSFPRNLLSEDQIQDLVDRGIADSPQLNDKNISFLRIEAAELAVRLSSLSAEHLDLIDLFLLDYKGFPLKGIVVPDDWPTTLMQQLYVRGIIAPIHNGRDFVFAVDDYRMLTTEVVGAEGIVNLWAKNAKSNPTATLENNEGIHWNNRRVGQVVTRPRKSKYQVDSDEEENFDYPEPKSKSKGTKRSRKYAEDYTEQDKLIELFRNNDKKVSFNESYSHQLFKRARKESIQIERGDKSEREVRLLSGEYVLYFFNDKNPVAITKESQIQLDRQIAKKTQREEYESSQSKNKYRKTRSS